MKKINKENKIHRLSIFRSNMHIYAQVIDEATCKTVVAGSDSKIEKGLTKSLRARKVGSKLAQDLSKIKIKKVFFDRGSRKYLGRIKALVEAVREGGITI